MARKLGCRDVVSAVRPGRLFYITDSVSHRRYLVDTGSAFSIMPWKSATAPAGPSLTAADGRRIPCWGEQSFTVTIGGVPRRWRFLLAAVSLPIIGINFLRSHGLLVDVANLRLLPGELPVAAVGLTASQAAPAVRPCSYAEAVRGTSSSPLRQSLFQECNPPTLPHWSGRPLPRSPPLQWPMPHRRRSRIGWATSAPVSRQSSAPVRLCRSLSPPTVYNTLLPPWGSRPPPDFAAWTPSGWQRPRQSFKPCSTRASFVAPAASGVALCTWSKRRTVPGVPAVTTAV
jgi:hypothetical protein